MFDQDFIEVVNTIVADGITDAQDAADTAILEINPLDVDAQEQEDAITAELEALLATLNVPTLFSTATQEKTPYGDCRPCGEGYGPLEGVCV